MLSNGGCRINGHAMTIGVVSSSGTEAHQAPLYHLLLAGWQKLAGVPARMPDPGLFDIGYGVDPPQ